MATLDGLLSQRTNSVTDLRIPAVFAEHPLVKFKLYFTLPGKLLAAVIQEVGEDRFDPKLLCLERELSRICGNHTFNVGFWGSRPIQYGLLHREPWRLLEEVALELGLQDPAYWADAVAVCSARLEPFVEIARGYCGWLLTNPLFHREHRDLFTTWKQQVSRFGRTWC